MYIMNRPIVLSLILIIGLIFSCLFIIQPVEAESKTIVVPDDCPTIASAIGSAAEGDTIFIKSGTYEGPINQTLIIDKSISLVGENTASTILNLHPKYNVTWILTSPMYDYSDAMQIDADDVRLTNLTLKFTGNMKANGNRVQIIGNDIWSHSTATGLSVNGSECNIANNTFLGFIKLAGSSNSAVENKAFSLTLQDAYHNIVYSNVLQTLGLSSSDANIISKNTVSTGNVWYAAHMSNSSGNTFYDNYIEAALWNTNLMISYNSTNNTFYNNAFISDCNPDYIDLYINENIASIDSTSHNNSWDNGSVGNYWNNYQIRYPDASEIDNSGIGNTPYVIDENNTDYYPLINCTINVTLRLTLHQHLLLPLHLHRTLLPHQHPQHRLLQVQQLHQHQARPLQILHHSNQH